MPKTNIMIDLETTGKKPGCHILEIGACTFASENPAKLMFDGLASYDDPRFTKDPDTMIWWDKQPVRITALVFSGQRPIDEVLKDFSLYLNSFPEGVIVWGNAASFDLKILEHAYEVCKLPLPWKFYDEMCYRTLKNLYPQIPFKKPGNAHVALEDAIAQATHAEEILRYKAAVEGGAS